MSIRFVCEHCGSAMKIKDELAGRKGNCPKCKAEFVIPTSSTLNPASGPGDLDGSSEYSIAMPKSAVVEGGSGRDSSELPDFPAGDESERDTPRSSRRDAGKKRPAADFDPDDPFASLDDDNDAPRPKKKAPRAPDPADDFDDNPFDDEFEKPAAKSKKSPRRPEPEPEQEDWEDFDEQTGGAGKPKRALPGAKGSAATIADDFMRSFSGSGADDLGEEEAPKKKRRIFGGDDDKGLSEGKFELSDMLMYGATRALPAVVGIVLVVWLVYMGASSVMSGSFSYPAMGKVTGQVKLDGVPLRGALVSFQPIGEQDEGLKQSNSVARTDDSGNYRLQYVAEVEGAAVGRHRVEIRASNAQSQEIIPKWYNARTMLRQEVGKGNNVINFDLDSKKPPEGWKE